MMQDKSQEVNYTKVRIQKMGSSLHFDTLHAEANYTRLESRKWLNKDFENCGGEEGRQFTETLSSVRGNFNGQDSSE